MVSDSLPLIVNPEAGHGLGRVLWKELGRASRRLGLKLESCVTTHRGHAAALAAEQVQQGASVLVVMGGDGTVGEVVNGIVGSDIVLGIIAAGTGNDIARSLGLPVNQPARALEVVCTGIPVEIDLGKAGGRYFVSVLGVGFPVEVAAQANRMKRPRGPAVFLLSMCRAILRMKAVRVTLELQAESIEADLTSVLVQNTPYTGGGLLIAPEAKLNDGLLDVITVGNIGKVDLMLNLPKLYRGGHVGHRSFTLFQCRTLSIRSEDRLTTMFDGDLCGCTPLEIKAARSALRVLVQR